MPATTPTSRDFPWLARQTAVTTDGLGHLRPEYAKQQPGAAFTLASVTFGARTGADIPWVLVHRNNFARRVRLEVVVPGRKRSVGVALERDHVPRNSVENLFAQPSALATRATPVETWTSPAFRIARPD